VEGAEAVVAVGFLGADLCFFFGFGLVAVVVVVFAVEVVLVELLPQPAATRTTARAARRRVRRINPRLTTATDESFGARARKVERQTPYVALPSMPIHSLSPAPLRARQGFSVKGPLPRSPAQPWGRPIPTGTRSDGRA
jgi:hypothetical protein